MTNKNYTDDIIYSKENIRNQSSFCSLFKIFENSNEFCISYKRMFLCNICNKNMEINELKSAPIFSIDDEDCQFNSLEDIFNHRYTSYSSGCPICINNNIDSNAFVLISNISLPNFLVVALEFNDFSPNVPLTIYTMENGIKVSKKIFKRNINLNVNNLNFQYQLKSFIVFKYPNHFVAYYIDIENSSENTIKCLFYDDQNLGYIKSIDIKSIDQIFVDGYAQTLIYEKN